MVNDMQPEQGDGVRYFPVPLEVGNVNLRQRPVLFHGVNKSGSLACAAVLQQAYKEHGRESEYMCRYFGIPDNLDAALSAFTNKYHGSHKHEKNSPPSTEVCGLASNHHVLLIDHNLVGRSVEFPNASYITLLRSPVRRMLSCYFWIKRHAPEQLRGRDFSVWLKEAGLAYSLVFQFACFAGAGQDVKLNVQKLPPEDVKKMAEDWFDEHVALYGITECFEESLFVLSAGLGLPSIPLWQPDKRNILRPPWEQLSPALMEYIEEIIAYDIAFYEDRVSRLQPDFARLHRTAEFVMYKNACAAVRQTQESA